MEVQIIEEWLPAIYELNQLIFQDPMKEKIHNRLSEVKNPLLLTIGSPDSLQGYKLGYEWNKSTFYSWLGAVAPHSRRQGLARQMMEEQHAWCHERGYKKVKTKTLNQWKSMLTLNLAAGFNIVDTYQNKQGITKILLEKTLN